MFLYFIKHKSDTVHCLERFLADVSPFGKVGNILDLVPGVMVKKFRSDGGGEYMGHEFKQLLLKHSIKHEQSAPYSPHQNGIAERGWRTLFEMGRCLLIGSGLPKVSWPYAIMTAAHIRNRCYQNRTKQTPFFMLTGRKPKVGNMHVFGSVCYSLEQNKTKLDPCSKKGIFIGYDKESPAYLIYYADTKKIMRCRCVKFVDTQNILDNEGNTIENVLELDDDFPGNLIKNEIAILDVPTEGLIDNVPADVPEADKPEPNIPVEDL